MMLGLGKDASKSSTTGKPLKKLTDAQLTQVVTNIAAKGGEASKKQQDRATSAAALLVKRAPTEHATDTPVVFTQATFPTTAPPVGHRWVYDRTNNQYVPEPIPQGDPGAVTYLSSPTTGGGAAPDFSQFAAGTDAAGSPSTTTAPDFTGAATAGAASEPMSMKTKLILGAVAAGVVGLVILKRKRR